MSQTNNTNTSLNAQSAEQAIAWQRYMLKREHSLPNWLIENSMAFFFISMFACWMLFGYVPKYDLILTAAISIVLFFFVGRSMSNKFSLFGEKKFLRSVFTVGLVVRILWILYMFFVFNPRYYGNTYGDTADVDWYMAFGRNLSLWLSGKTSNTLSQIIDINMAAIDDTAYPMILGIEYFLTGGVSSVFIPMVIKCMMSAYCAVSIYHITMRHFGSGTARIAAIFICLSPHIIYWCGSMMKETEMVFVCCLAINNLDKILMSGDRFTFRSIWPGILIGLVLFFMRTPLGLALFLAIFVHIVLASTKVISIGKKIIVAILISTMVLVTISDRILVAPKKYVEMVQSGSQEANINWRSGAGGNSFAKYAGAAVFAPLIFTIPFPTLNVANEAQLTQMLLAGGNYIKNILSFFVIYVLFILLLTKEWRNHVFIIAYTCGYLVVLVFSSFAQSGRFHMPIMPMLMIFAAHGVQMAKTDKKMRKWFIYVLCTEVFVCLVWNWFKLAGRGII